MKLRIGDREFSMDKRADRQAAAQAIESTSAGEVEVVVGVWDTKKVKKKGSRRKARVVRSSKLTEDMQK
jgi:hypothetical protein